VDRLTPHSGREALAAFLDWLAHERRASPRTCQAYEAGVRSYLSFLERHFGEAVDLTALGAVSAADLRAFLAFRRSGEHPLSARSLSQALSAVRAFHRFLDARLETPNTAVGLVRGPRVRPGAPRPVSEDQASGLVAEAGDEGERPAWVALRDQAVLLLLWGCGLRISEALSL
jgi:integrase/recombinase XerC